MTAPLLPEETPLAILANVQQMLRSLLDAQPEATAFSIPRHWVAGWLEDLRVVTAVLRHEGRGR